MRKMTLRSYVGLLRLEDVLTRHPFYYKAAKCAIEVYIRLHDKPLPAEHSTAEMDEENLPPNELKKLKRKQLKAKKKAEMEASQQQQAEKRKEQHNKSRRDQNNQDGDPEAPQLDELVPDKLARPEHPLAKALDFLRPLQQLAKDHLDTHLMSFEVYYRKGKLLLMLQSLKRARKLVAADHPGFYSCLMRFQHVADTLPADLDANIRTVIDNERQHLFKGQTAAQITDQILRQHPGSIEHVLEATRWAKKHAPARQTELLKLAANFDFNHVTLEVSPVLL